MSFPLRSPLWRAWARRGASRPAQCKDHASRARESDTCIVSNKIIHRPLTHGAASGAGSISFLSTGSRVFQVPQPERDY